MYVLAGQRKSPSVIQYDLSNGNHLREAQERATQLSHPSTSPHMETTCANSYKEVMTTAVNLIKTLRNTESIEHTQTYVNALEKAREVIAKQKENLNEQTTYTNNTRVIDHRLNKKGEPNYEPQRSTDLEKMAMMQENFQKIDTAIEDLIKEAETPKYHNGSRNGRSQQNPAPEPLPQKEPETTRFANPTPTPTNEREVPLDDPPSEPETKVYIEKTKPKKKGYLSRLASAARKKTSKLAETIRSYTFKPQQAFA